VAQERGRSLHALLGSALAARQYLEVRVRRDGIVGQIDLLEDDPTELKTTESLPPADRVAESRPAYIDQLAMYCALTDRPTGRLLLVRAVDGVPTEAVALRARFRALPPLLDEMRARAESFRRAVDRGDATGLPRCEWYNRGCEVQSAKVCACTGEEPTSPPLGPAALEELRQDTTLSESVTSRLASLRSTAPGTSLDEFRELLYPRRAFFDRTAEEESPSAGWSSPPSRLDLYRAIVDLLEGGPTGEVTRRPVLTGEPPAPVPCFQGLPYLVKVTRALPTARPGELPDRQPQYFLDLGLRAAALGADAGWLFLGYERAARWEDRLLALKVRFDPASTMGSVLRHRQQAWHRAMESKDAAGLAPCPGWMFETCPYRDRCGCGGSAPAGPNR